MVSLRTILASVALFLVATTDAQAANPSCPRVRKSWDRYTPDEKTVYLNAVAKAMDVGLYQKFIDIHGEYMSNMEAHGTCVFILWHRKFLVGFENMLRSMDPVANKCLTLPYFNYVQQNLDYINGKCTNMESCAAQMRDFGGSTAGKWVPQQVSRT
ncbi:hypothetical protein As57867_006575, partial [Aphanomyces stellatus]